MFLLLSASSHSRCHREKHKRKSQKGTENNRLCATRQCVSEPTCPKKRENALKAIDDVDKIILF